MKLSVVNGTAFIFSDHFIDALIAGGFPITTELIPGYSGSDPIKKYQLLTKNGNLIWYCLLDENSPRIGSDTLEPWAEINFENTTPTQLPLFLRPHQGKVLSDPHSHFSLQSLVFSERELPTQLLEVKNSFCLIPSKDTLHLHFKLKKKYPLWGIRLVADNFQQLKEKFSSEKMITLSNQETLHIELFPGTWDLFICPR
ncbi:MAG: hypothetical protein BroJett040_06820 [Oligoflexia bacterium]|nr:MAG: hypothetical protein BroJett040_06820 [Oligoflexia bacterium]